MSSNSTSPGVWETFRHRNSTWLILAKHSETDSSSSPPGRTLECIPTGLWWSHLDFFRFSIKCSAGRQERLCLRGSHLGHAGGHGHGFLFVLILYQKLIVNTFSLGFHKQNQKWRCSFVADSLLTLQATLLVYIISNLGALESSFNSILPSVHHTPTYFFPLLK